MATPRVSTYSTASGDGVYAGIARLRPAWRDALAPWQWVQFAAASIANTLPTVMPAIGSAKNRVEAWCGLAVYQASVVRAGVGGHADWSGNEGYSGDLNVASPAAPLILSQPTPNAQVVADASYYVDGRPTATHTYYALHPDRERGHVVRLGVAAATGSGNFHSAKCDAYDLAAGDWLPAGTIPDFPEFPDYTLSQCQHPVTGNVYAVGSTKLWRYNMAARTWTDLGAMPSGINGTAAAGRASAIDTTRNRLVIFGDSYATPTGMMVYDLTAGTWTRPTLSGALASFAAAQAGNVAHYDAALDAFVMRRSWSALPNVPLEIPPTFLGGGEMLRIDPVTWEVSTITTTGGASIPATNAGVWGLLQPMPALGGYVYEPLGTGGVWFLAGP